MVEMFNSGINMNNVNMDNEGSGYTTSLGALIVLAGLAGCQSDAPKEIPALVNKMVPDTTISAGYDTVKRQPLTWDNVNLSYMVAKLVPDKVIEDIIDDLSFGFDAKSASYAARSRVFHNQLIIALGKDNKGVADTLWGFDPIMYDVATIGRDGNGNFSSYSVAEYGEKDLETADYTRNHLSMEIMMRYLKNSDRLWGAYEAKRDVVINRIIENDAVDVFISGLENAIAGKDAYYNSFKQRRIAEGGQALADTYDDIAIDVHDVLVEYKTYNTRDN